MRGNARSVLEGRPSGQPASRLALAAALLVVGSVLAQPPGSESARSPASEARHARGVSSVVTSPLERKVEPPETRAVGRVARARGIEGGVGLTEEPEPYFQITWTAVGKGMTDVTDTDGTRTVTTREVSMSGSTIVRLYPDGSQDDYPYQLTVTDDFSEVRTYPCPGGGVGRDHFWWSVKDPNRYAGPDYIPNAFPLQRNDGSWFLAQPFAGLGNARYFDYQMNSDDIDCQGQRSTDGSSIEAGLWVTILLDPGDIEGNEDGTLFQKEVDLQPPSEQPPMTVHWTVRAQRLLGRDLTVQRLEVTQGLQNEANGIPLVRERRTVVRAYLGIGAEPGPVEGVTGLLTGYAGERLLGVVAPFNPGERIDAPILPNWRNIDDTLNFELHHSWTLEPLLRLVVEVNHDLSVVEESYLNNELEALVATNDCQDINIGYLPIFYNPPGGHLPPNPSPNIRHGHEFLRKVYPVGDDALHYSRWPGYRIDYDVTDGAGAPGAAVLHELSTLLLSSSAPRPDKIVGWLPPGASSNAVGLAYQPGVSAWVLDTENPEWWRGAFAHEVAHCYGREHSEYTTGGRHWFDVYERKIKPPRPGGDDLFDFMPPFVNIEPHQWVSPESYGFLFPTFCSGAAAAANFEPRVATVGDNLLVSGFVHDVVPPTGSLSPLHRLSTAPTHIPDPPSAGPGYCVKLKDAGNALLAQYCFDAFFVVEANSPGAGTTAPFALVVPDPAGLARVELTRGTTTLLDSRTSSASPPSVTLSYPSAPGLTLSGVQTVTWTGSDPDGNPLAYSLLYSTDNGSTWIGVGAGITETSYELDFSELPGGNAARIRVLASDGFHTAEDTSDNGFSVGNKGPTAAIVSPPPDQIFNAGSPVTLHGEGSDLEDGIIAESALSWSSSKDGFLGTGRLLEASLSVGSHVITLTATDGDGLTATDTVDLTVAAVVPPAPPGFYTVAPCRVVDTRDPDGPWGGPPLTAGYPRTFPIGGRCGIPLSANAVSFNFTITQATALGHLTVHPAGTSTPLVSTLNFRAGQTRANNAVVALGSGGGLTVVSGQPAGTVHVIIDVNGYFE